MQSRVTPLEIHVTGDRVRANQLIKPHTWKGFGLLKRAGSFLLVTDGFPVEALVTRIDRITISRDNGQPRISRFSANLGYYQHMTGEEIHELVRKDGFQSSGDFYAHYKRDYRNQTLINRELFVISYIKAPRVIKRGLTGFFNQPRPVTTFTRR